MTAWRRLQKKELDTLKYFLLPREARCANLASHLKNELTNPLLFGESDVFAKVTAEGIQGAIVLYRRKQMFPVFGDGYLPNDGERMEILGLIGKANPNIFSIMGTERDVRFGESLFSRTPFCIDYYMYKSLGRLDAVPECSLSGLTIKKALKGHARRLIDLQEGYEKEEVLIMPEKFNRTACILQLKRQLARQIIYFAEYRGLPVAKAGTNARGYGFYQLGGIFTKREFRNAGIGALLVHRLAETVLNEGKEVTLFVKRENKPAMALYEKLGLKRHAHFRIAYYL